MAANDIQIDGEHYKKETGKPQHWDWAADMPYLEGRCTAYIERHQDKKGLLDLEKAVHFLQKIMEVRYGAQLVWEVVRTGGVEGCEMDRSSQNPYANAPGAVQGFARNPEDKCDQTEQRYGPTRNSFTEPGNS